MTQEEMSALLARHGFTKVMTANDPCDSRWEAREAAISSLIEEAVNIERQLIMERLKQWVKRRNKRVSEAIDLLWTTRLAGWPDQL